MALVDITKSDVLSFASILGTGNLATTDQAWVDILNFVNQVNLTACDSDFDRRLARIYLAAHVAMTTRLASSGAAGPVTSESAGGVRQSYGLIAQATTGTSLGTTRYGQMYMDILGMTLAGGPMVI